MFDENDLSLEQTPTNEDAEREAKIRRLKAEIRYLKSEMNLTPQFHGLIGGSAIGHALGMGALGVGLGAILGYNLAKGKPISPELRNQIKVAIQQKKQQLDKLMVGQDVSNAMTSGIMSSDQMLNYEYRELPFTGKWQMLLGKPAQNFHALVFGKPKMGKSYFSVSLAKYLSNFGRVLYIAAEEGFSSTLKKKIADFGLQNSRVDFANFRDFSQVKNILRAEQYDFVFIDSVNYMRLLPEQVEELKNILPESGFVTVQQATKQGHARGSQEFGHNCDIIVEIVDGVAYAQGRFAPPAEMEVFDRPLMPERTQQTQQTQQILTNNTELDGFEAGDFDEFL